MRRVLRLSVRLAQFELLAFGGAILASVVAAFVAAGWIESLRPPPACLAELGQQSLACELALRTWYDATQTARGLLSTLLVALPFIAGLLLGVPIVAREIERGTARLVWSLAPSRTRWYLGRLLPVLAMVGLLSYAAGLAMDRLLAATEPGLDLANAFAGFGARGVVLASWAVFAFAIGVATGALLGRMLPAVIVAALVVAVGLTGGEAVHQRILRSEAVPRSETESGQGDLFVDQRFQLPDGSLVGYEHFANTEPFDGEGRPRYPIVNLVVPGERYREVETREALVLAGGSLVALLLAAGIVGRKRPD